MQLVRADNGVPISMEKIVPKTNCSMCINETQHQQTQRLISPVPTPDLSRALIPIKGKPSTSTGQPFYVCTVTCCDSVNCTKPSTTSLISKAIVSKVDNSCHTYGTQFPTPSSAPLTHRVNGVISPPLEQTIANSCPACVKITARQNRPRLVLITNPSTEYMNGDCNSANSVLPQVKNTTYEGSISPKLNSVKNDPFNQSILATPLSLGKSTSPTPAKDLPLRRSPKLQLMGNEKINTKALLHSPELSSSPPVLGNSSFTDYTEPYTPVCTSVNSNAADSTTHFKFGISRKASPLNSEYSFYFANVENHGFFRKAVPALPISMAVLLCLCNLILPGSGAYSIATKMIVCSRKS